jgi:quercetin dioxygenase-like cupin family protein
MPIEVIDMVDFAHQEKRRKEIFNTPRFHAWMHYYKPGHKDELHCHNADQTFFVIDGECTMHFPDGGKAVLTPEWPRRSPAARSISWKMPATNR